jgi:hypothetical protein
MRKIIQIIFTVMLCCVAVEKIQAQCAAPVINSFTPSTGFIGSTVTITGANFDPIAANNQVFFGATKATVVSSSFGQMQVIVPVGATYAPISVKNGCNLIGTSAYSFNGIFCGTTVTTSTYATESYSMNVSGGYQMLSQDMDLDGKTDMLVCGFTSNRVSIARNMSTPGTFNFAPKFDLNFAGATRCIAPADYDGDGKIDLAVVDNGVNGIRIYKNTSVPGTLSFTGPIDIGGIGGYQCAAGDLNNDGKLDIAVGSGNNVVILRNTSTPGSISFVNSGSVSIGGFVTGLVIADVDNDGIKDIGAANANSNLAYAVRNTTVQGSTSFTFAAAQSYATGAYPYRLFVGDFDKDGKIDFITNNFSGASVSVFRNTSSPGSVSFASALTLSSPTSNYRIGVGDADGDGRPDIVTKSSGENKFSVYINTSSAPGSISFNNRIDYSGLAEVSGVVIADLDGDYVPDISTSGISYNTMRIYRNTSTVIDNTAPNAICKNITVALSPTGTATVTAAMIDNGSSDACGIGSLLINDAASVNFTCANIGANQVTLKVTDRAGNVNTCQAIVTVAPAAVVVSGQTTVCQGQTVALQANLGDSYQWQKDGVDIPGATAQNYTATTTGNYSVTVTNGGGCSGTSAPVAITVNNNPTVSTTPSGNAAICGGPLTITASQSSIYQWKLNGNNISGATQQSYNATTAGTYSVQVVDLFGCSATSSPITVTVGTPATATITSSGPTTKCAGTSVTLTANSGASYLWSNGATTQSITVSTPGTYSVTVTNATGCSATSAPVTVANIAGVDTDGDGIPDACDADDDNDGILDVVECNKSNFFWSNPPTVSGNTATGVINGVNYTYTSSRAVTTTPDVYAHYLFPTSYNIPNIKSIQNIYASNNTLTFASPVTNPVLVFSSIGNPGLYVPIEFSAPVDILWSTAVVKNSATRITGNEGYAIIRLNGTFSSISFNYLADENYVNFLFGADFQTCGDTDGDGTPDKLDTDSDNDGCPDAIEGSQNPTMAQTANGRLTGGIDANGVPSLVNGGQGIGTSQNANVNCFCQVGIDKTAPVITCPANITLNATSASGAVVNYTTPTATDDCAVTITRTAGSASGAVFPIGTTTVTHTATDAAGNVSTCSFEVIITGLPPQIVSPGNQTASAAAGTCGAVVSFAATDTVGIPASTITYSHQPGSVFPVGVTTVTATATNAVGSSSVTFTVTVTDNENPTISGLLPISVNADNGSCAATNVALGTPVTGDNCGVASVTNNAPASYPVGSTTVTWTVTDIHGNSTTTTQVVTVTDNQAPTVLVQNITVYLDASGNVSITPAQINNGSTDNCGIATVTLDKTSFNCSNVGANTVNLTVTDIHGNSATVAATVTVVDAIKPTVNTPAAQVFCQNTTASYTVPAITVSDNCGIASVSYVITGATSRTGSGLNASGAFAVGNSTITWTVTDVNNNVTVVSVPVTVNPAPTATISVSTPDAFCNKLTLTANSSSVITGYAWSVNSSAFASTQAIFLDNTHADGNYVVFVTDNKGCTSLSPVSYNYQKQNIISNYTILAYKEAELKEYNTVQTGSVGVMSKKGEAEIGKYSSVAAPGAFVKAPKIEAKSGSNVPTKIYAVATVTLPTMQYNSASVNNLPNFTTNQNATITLSGNYKNLTVRRGSNVVLTGNTYGNINIEEGSTVRFTSTTINVEHLKVGKGKDNGQTVVRFADNTSVLVAKHVQIEEDCFINPDSYKVTFYLGRVSNHSCNNHRGDDRDDDDHDRGHGDGDQKFEVKGGNTTVIANVYAPTGDIKVKGGESCHKNHVATTVRMTGLFIGYEVEGDGKNVIWNNYTCGSAMPMPEVNNTAMVVGEEQDADIKLDVKVLPNPTLTHFEMIVSSDDKQTPVQIRVISGAGRVLNAMKATVGQRVQFGQEYTSGMYVAEVVQGNKRKTVKLIKGK